MRDRTLGDDNCVFMYGVNFERLTIWRVPAIELMDLSAVSPRSFRCGRVRYPTSNSCESRLESGNRSGGGSLPLRNARWRYAKRDRCENHELALNAGSLFSFRWVREWASLLASVPPGDSCLPSNHRAFFARDLASTGAASKSVATLSATLQTRTDPLANLRAR